MNSYTNQSVAKPIIGIAPEKISHLINDDVLDVHAEEAAFLWTQHYNAVNRPDYSLKDLIDLDERINAHLDGLMVASTAGWQKCLSLLDEGIEYLFPTTILALVQQNNQWLEIVKNDLLDWVDNQGYSATKPVISALGWLDYAQVKSHIDLWLQSKNPVLQYIALAGLSVHRQDPKEHLTQFIQHDSFYIRARAYRLAGELKRQDLLRELYLGLQEQEQHCRFWAAWALALLGDRNQSLQTLSEFATLSTSVNENSFKYQQLALQILFSVQHQSLPLQKQLMEQFKHNKALLPAAVYALGITGNPRSVNGLIAMMAVPELAKLAGEAFCMITGADLDYDDLMLDDEDESDEEKQLLDIAEVNFDEDSDIDDSEEETESILTQENFADDYQNYIDDLLVPDTKLIKSWWQTQQQHLDNGQRYLAGLPVTIPNLQHIVKNGFQRQRQIAVLQLALHNQQQILLNTQGQGVTQ